MRLRFATPTATFVAPHPRLAGCVRGYVLRDTTRGPALRAAQRVNHYPATVHAALIWYLEGSSCWAAPAAREGEPMPATALLGPQTRPFSTSNPGAVRTFGVVLYPQALHALAGLDMSRVVDRAMPVQACLDDAWAAMCRTVRLGRDDDERIHRVEAFLLERCAEVGFARSAPSAAVEWHHAFRGQAAREGLGMSLRSLERNVLAWAGQPLRRIARLARVEATLVDTRDSAGGHAPDWADVAARTGYSDQPHLCRHTRQATGLAPDELARRSETDESFWLYRIWSRAR